MSQLKPTTHNNNAKHPIEAGAAQPAETESMATFVVDIAGVVVHGAAFSNR